MLNWLSCAVSFKSRSKIMNITNSQKGSALLISLAIMLLVFLAVMLTVNNSITETELSFLTS